MSTEGLLTQEILTNLKEKLSLSASEETSLKFQVDWFKHHIELEAYLSANRLMGLQSQGLHLPIATLDDDMEIQELNLPHEIDWDDADNASFRKSIESNGIKLAMTEPSIAFKTFYSVALPTQISKIVEQTILHSRAANTDIGLYMPQNPYISHSLGDGETLNIVNIIERDTSAVESRMISKPMYNRFFAQEQTMTTEQTLSVQSGITR